MAFVELEQRGHVGLITINRPEVLNALNLQVLHSEKVIHFQVILQEVVVATMVVKEVIVLEEDLVI